MELDEVADSHNAGDAALVDVFVHIGGAYHDDNRDENFVAACGESPFANDVYRDAMPDVSYVVLCAVLLYESPVVLFARNLELQRAS